MPERTAGGSCGWAEIAQGEQRREAPRRASAHMLGDRSGLPGLPKGLEPWPAQSWARRSCSTCTCKESGEVTLSQNASQMSHVWGQQPHLCRSGDRATQKPPRHTSSRKAGLGKSNSLRVSNQKGMGKATASSPMEKKKWENAIQHAHSQRRPQNVTSKMNKEVAIKMFQLAEAVTGDGWERGGKEGPQKDTATKGKKGHRGQKTSGKQCHEKKLSLKRAQLAEVLQETKDDVGDMDQGKMN